MTKYELFDYLHSKPDPDKNGSLKKEKNFKKHFPELYEDFLKFEFCDDLNSTCFVQKLWHYMQDDPGNLGHCKECGKRLEFKSFSYGYYDFCSLQCSNKNRETNLKRQKTNETKHGGIGFASAEIQRKIKETMTEQHGHPYSSKCSEILNKIIESNNKNNNGIGFASKTISEKIKNTMKEKHDAEYSMRSKNTIEKRRQTKIENSNNLLKITDETFIMKCMNPDCDLCEEKQFEINKKTFRTRINRNHELCTILNPITKQTSIYENDLFQYISEIYDGIIERNDRTFLNGKEIDIYLPNIKLGFEFNGDYWHANPIFYKNTDIISNYTAEDIWDKDENKIKYAKMIGIDIVTIWEYDWIHSRESCKKLIKTTIINKLKNL